MLILILLFLNNSSLNDTVWGMMYIWHKIWHKSFWLILMSKQPSGLDLSGSSVGGPAYWPRFDSWYVSFRVIYYKGEHNHNAAIHLISSWGCSSRSGSVNRTQWPTHFLTCSRSHLTKLTHCSWSHLTKLTQFHSMFFSKMLNKVRLGSGRLNLVKWGQLG